MVNFQHFFLFLGGGGGGVERDIYRSVDSSSVRFQNAITIKSSMSEATVAISISISTGQL